MPTSISCPDPAQLVRLLEGELSESEQTEMTQHLDGCARCQHAVQEVASGGKTWAEVAAYLKSEHSRTEREPALQQAVAELAGPSRSEETLAGPGVGVDNFLDFLAPTTKLGSLGRLDHYEVMELIGRGGMGIVLKAFDESLHRVVAVKVLAPQWATNATARKRFAREAKAAAAVCHDHVVTIHAVEGEKPVPYLVMQCVAGSSLQDKLDRDGPLGVKEILRIGLQTAEGLAAAHKQGLVHRDIKPANILLENGVERVKITDFGLARAVDDASLTQSGVVAGTPQYMSPEQAQGEAIDYRSDLFSLGSVLYAMCTGRPPFRATGTMAVLKRVCEDVPRPIREINPDMPDWLCDIIAKLHAKNPAERFQSAAEVADLLSQHLAHLQQPTHVPKPSKLAGPVAGGGAMELQTRTPQTYSFKSSSRGLRLYFLGFGTFMTALIVIVFALRVRTWDGFMFALMGVLVALLWLVSIPLGWLILARSQRKLRLVVGPDGVLRQNGAIRQLVPWTAISRVRVRNIVGDPNWHRRRELWEALEQSPRIGRIMQSFSWCKPGPREPLAVEVYTAEGLALKLMEFEKLAEIAKLIEAGPEALAADEVGAVKPIGPPVDMFPPIDSRRAWRFFLTSLFILGLVVSATIAFSSLGKIVNGPFALRAYVEFVCAGLIPFTLILVGLVRLWSGRRRWLVLATTAIGLLAIFGLLEATGVTHFRDEVARGFAPSGTLTVEGVEPGVMLMVDGRELGAGGGVFEVPVPPGEHIVEARQDGELIHKRSVDIRSNGEQVIRIPAPFAGSVMFEGHWTVLREESSGLQKPADAQALWWEFAGRKRREKFDAKDDPAECAYRIDTTKSPPQIDLVSRGDILRHGIYSLKDGELTVCFSTPPEPRPTSFVTRRNTTLYLTVLRRTGEATPSPNDLDKWMQSVAALPGDEQAKAVAAKLKEVNPGFDGHVEPLLVQDGVLIHVALNSDEVADLWPLRALTRLERLNLGSKNGQKGVNAKFSDLSPLRGLPLKALYLHSAHVSDLSPLKDMPLEELYIDHTGVRDLSPLHGMPLRSLTCDHCQLRDLSPLHGTPLKQLFFDFDPRRDAAVLRSIKTLEWINGKPAAEFWVPVNPQILEAADCLACGWKLAAEGKWTEAEAEFQKAVGANPDDPQVWRWRGQIQAQGNRVEQAAADFSKALDLIPAAMRHSWSGDPAGVDTELCLWDDVFARTAKLRSKDIALWIARTNVCCVRERWKEAAEASATLVERDPRNHAFWFKDAPLRLQVGDVEGYRRNCREELERFGQTKDPARIEQIVKTCSLAPTAVVDFGPVLKMAEFALIGNEKLPGYPWLLQCHGLACYRAGEYERAAEQLRKCLDMKVREPSVHPLAYSVLAMAHYRCGRTQEARSALQQARAIVEETRSRGARANPGDPFAFDWLRCEILYREAEQLIGKDSIK